MPIDIKKVAEHLGVKIEYDSNSDKYDKYNRLLAWVFVDGKESLHAGYSCYRTRRELKELAKGYPKYMDWLMKLVEEREENGKSGNSD